LFDKFQVESLQPNSGWKTANYVLKYIVLVTTYELFECKDDVDWVK